MAANPDWPRSAALARMLSTLFIVAVIVNYLWELAQAPLFVGGDDFNAMSWHCFVASLGDGVLVLLIFGVGSLVLRSQNWFVRPGVRGYVLMFVSGFTIAIAVEWIAVHVLQRWAYLPAMPRVPGLDIGVAPIVQMLALPPLIFRIVAARTSRSRGA
jgi:hypothetical protein